MLGQKCNDPPHLLLLHKFFPLLHINFVYSLRAAKRCRFSALMPNTSPFLGLVRALFRPPRCLLACLLKDSEPLSICSGKPASSVQTLMLLNTSSPSLWQNYGLQYLNLARFWEAAEIII